MTIALIDYGSGNLHSAAKALQKAADERSASVVITRDPEQLRHASHIVLPGVGAFADCMAGLQAIDGLIEALNEQVMQVQKPFLGICVGMQMILERGLEHGTHAGLGWMKGEVVPITPHDPTLPIPHMGWNELEITAPNHPIFKDIPSGAHAYFVHSFHALCTDTSQVLATADYGGSVSACIGRDNMVGTQFHPEKSQQVGLKIIKNFLAF